MPVRLFGQDMWVMNEYDNKESWKMVTSFPYSVGDDLDRSSGFPIVLSVLENGVLLVYNEGKLVLFYSKNNTWKNVTAGNEKVEFYVGRVGLFMETLVSPYGGDNEQQEEEEKKEDQ